LYEECNCKDCNSKELENSQAGVLLENFWCKAIFRTQFALLLFLRGLMSSISSFCYRTKFRCKKSLFKNQVLVTYSNCSQTFLKRTFCCEGDFVGEPFGVRRCLLKNPLAVIDCDRFQTFAERENFFEKDAGKLLTKTLSVVSYNIHSNMILHNNVSENVNRADHHGSQMYLTHIILKKY